MKLALVLLLAVVALAAKVSIETGLVNENIDRSIDLTSSVAKEISTIIVSNGGSKAVNSYYYTVPKSLAAKVAFVSAVDEKENQLAVAQVDADAKDAVVFRVEFGKSLAAGAETTITVTATFLHTMRPFPKEIVQSERQLVVFEGTLYAYSPYKTLKQKTTARLASGRIESYTDEKPVQVAGEAIVFGPYQDQAAYSSKDLSIHFENNKPFVTITNAVQEYEVSHWGNIAVETSFEAKHDGAKLKGPFSRYDYQRSPSPSSVRSLRLLLPTGAKDMYYRDEIGNISTSNFRIEDDESATFEMRPRFPLFGGWQTTWYQGYNLALDSYLSTEESTGRYRVRVPLNVVFEGTGVDSLTVRVILPEGASDIKLTTPLRLAGEVTFEKHFTYLDTAGRPVVVATIKGLTAEQNGVIVEVTYDFSTTALLREPLMLVFAYFAFFLACMFYVRFELKIDSSRESSTAPRVADILSRVSELQDRRSGALNDLEGAVTPNASADARKAYNATKERVVEALKAIDREAAQLAEELAPLDASLAAKLQSLIEKEADRARRQRELHLIFLEQPPKKAQEASAALRGSLESLEADIETLSSQLSDD